LAPDMMFWWWEIFNQGWTFIPTYIHRYAILSSEWSFIPVCKILYVSTYILCMK
jgi:hypothetical protein